MKLRSLSPAWLAGAAILIVLVGFGAFRLLTPAPTLHPAKVHADMPPEPEWLKLAAAPVREAYTWAAAHEELLMYIPCYCGCNQAHTSNAGCYYTRDAAGKIIDYDSHAFG